MSALIAAIVRQDFVFILLIVLHKELAGRLRSLWLHRRVGTWFLGHSKVTCLRLRPHRVRLLGSLHQRILPVDFVLNITRTKPHLNQS